MVFSFYYYHGKTAKSLNIATKKYRYNTRIGQYYRNMKDKGWTLIDPILAGHIVHSMFTNQ